jgi:hypothetical protein
MLLGSTVAASLSTTYPKTKGIALGAFADIGSPSVSVYHKRDESSQVWSAHDYSGYGTGVPTSESPIPHIDPDGWIPLFRNALDPGKASAL